MTGGLLWWQCDDGVQEASDANRQQGAVECSQPVVGHREVLQRRRRRRPVVDKERRNCNSNHAVSTAVDRTIRYDTIRDAILTCAQKLT